MIIPDAIVHELFLNPELRKSDTRTVIFLLSNPGALSNGELAAGIGISPKSVNKSVKRLISAGIIQAGDPQAKKRVFIVHLAEPIEPPAVTEGNKDASFGTFMDRFNRIEEMLGALMDTKGAGLNPAHIPDVRNTTQTNHIQATMDHNGIPDGIEQDKNMTGTVTIQAIEKSTEPIQTEMMPQSDSERTKPLSVVTEQDAKGTANDTINADLDAALIRARGLLAAKQALLLKEKQKQHQPGARASIGDGFHALFGVQLPAGSDQAAAAVMIARKKTGKLDNVKSPLAYLSSLAGKVQPIVPSSVQLPPATVITSQLVTETSLDDYERRSRIKAAWFGLNDEQRIPFHELREKKAMSGIPGRKVPVELLAFQQFTQECLAGRVKI